jgi:hypothetical protein
MFGTIQRWLFLKALSHVKKKRGNKKVFSNNETSSIQILYELSTEQDQKALDLFVKQLKNNQKKVVCLGFQNEKVKLSTDITDMYSLQNVPLSQVPKGESIHQFLAHSPDILIVLCHHFYDHLKYVTFASQASLKVGLHFPKGESYFDVMIDSNPSIPYSEQIASIIHWMNIFSQQK